ncbi:MAG: MerR family transcriptional regulator [Nitrospirales bacterium]
MGPEPRPGGKLFYKIGEVSQIAKLPAYVLRFWESEFHFLKPRKSRGGQRLYVRQDIDTVFEIKRMLYEEGYTIAGVKRFWTRRGRGRPGRVRPREVAARVRGDLRAILRILESYEQRSVAGKS